MTPNPGTHRKHAPTRAAFREVLTEQLEASAGVPSGMPAEHDSAHVELVHQSGQLNQPHKRSKARTTEFVTNRLVKLEQMFGFKDPLHVLMEIANGAETYIAGANSDGSPIYATRDFKKTPDHKTRVMAAAELSSYIYAKRKSVEVTGAEGQPIAFNVVADTTEIPQMPSAEELEALTRERRQAALDAEKLIDAKVED